MNKCNLITGDAFKSICDDFLDETKPFIDISNKPRTIFLYTDWIEIFKSKILPHINYSFKLITHNADRSAPSGHIDILNDDRLIMWYGMNCSINHAKLQPIPIGIANERWAHGSKDTLQKVIHTNVEKKDRVYCNFNPHTTYRRRNLIDYLSNFNFVDIETESIPFEEYLLKLKSYKYVISPPGNSIDCHRIWESIYVNTIPIVLKDVALEYFYDLPILAIDDYTKLSTNLLDESYSNLHARSTLKSQLTHYTKLIKSK